MSSRRQTLSPGQAHKFDKLNMATLERMSKIASKGLAFESKSSITNAFEMNKTYKFKTNLTNEEQRPIELTESGFPS